MHRLSYEVDSYIDTNPYRSFFTFTIIVVVVVATLLEGSESLLLNFIFLQISIAIITTTSTLITPNTTTTGTIIVATSVALICRCSEQLQGADDASTVVVTVITDLNDLTVHDVGVTVSVAISIREASFDT